MECEVDRRARVCRRAAVHLAARGNQPLIIVGNEEVEISAKIKKRADREIRIKHALKEKQGIFKIFMDRYLPTTAVLKITNLVQAYDITVAAMQYFRY